jgi:hypothetical protein
MGRISAGRESAVRRFAFLLPSLLVVGMAAAGPEVVTVARSRSATIAGSTFSVSQAGGGTSTTLQGDWVPCGPPGGAAEGPGEDVIQPSRSRVLIARSRDGLHFERPSTDAGRLLLDQADIPDAVVLPSGRVLVYFMAGCRDYTPFGGARTMSDNIAVAVSDGGGAAGSWVFKDVSFDNESHGLERPFDPNIVLWKPDQNLLRMFVSQAAAGPSIATYSYTSTDGFTFTYEGKRYDPGPPDGIIDPETFRFDDTHWYIFSGGPNGFATSSDDGATFTRQGYFSDLVTNFAGYGGVPHDVAVTDIAGTYRAFASVFRPSLMMSGIDSLRSTASPWTSWEWEGPVLDVVAGTEACDLTFPTVVRLADDDWLMFYRTTIPNCECGFDRMLYHCSAPTTCTSFTISPTSVTPSAAAGSQEVIVTGSPSGCVGGSWSVSGNGSWLTVSPESGSGPGSVTVSWTQNTSTVRSGSATIAGNDLVVNQNGTPLPPCTEDAATMCLIGGRYQVTSTWKNQYAGGTVSTLKTARLTDATGAFWLFDGSTYEYLIRINTATDNGRAWIAIPTFTDVEFWVTVLDTVYGQTFTYHSPAGNRTLIYDPYTFVYP